MLPMRRPLRYCSRRLNHNLKILLLIMCSGFGQDDAVLILKLETIHLPNYQ